LILFYFRADIILGQGAFGKVMRASAHGITESEEKTLVAVKMVRGTVHIDISDLFHHSKMGTVLYEQ